MDSYQGPLESEISGIGEQMDLPVDSPAISRLIEEVRGTDFEVTRAYNRTYNRHNR